MIYFKEIMSIAGVNCIFLLWFALVSKYEHDEMVLSDIISPL